MKHTNKSLTNLYSQIISKEVFLRYNFELNNKMSGLTTPDILYSEYRKEMKHLSEVVKDRPLLIYRFTSSNCNKCYIEDLQNLQMQFSNNYDIVSALCSHRNERDLLILLKTYSIELSVFLIKHDSFNWIAEEEFKPYYFVLHPNMKISHIYVPDRNFPELNKQYIEGVRRFLLE